MLFSHNKKMGSAKGAVLLGRNVIQKRQDLEKFFAIFTIITL